MTALIKTNPTDATNVAAASLRGFGLDQGTLRIDDSALAERCAR